MASNVDADWQSFLMTKVTGKGKTKTLTYLGNLENAIRALTYCPLWAGKIARNEMSNEIMALASTPVCPAGEWQDEYTTLACAWMQASGIPVDYRDVSRAIKAVGSKNPRNPLVQYLRSLVWDRQERLGHWLTTYCGAADTPLNSLIGSKFLIGAVARPLRPGCRMDHMLVLEGEQGLGKSTVIAILGGEFNCEILPDFHSKDAIIVTHRYWTVEVSELAAMAKSNLESIKAFITRTEDVYRPPYAEHAISLKRSFVLIGNINPRENGYLIDPTGNRRFWPVTVGRLDLEALRADRDQLIAEALYCFERGDPWWVENGAQQNDLSEAQELRFEHDEWTAIITSWLARNPEASEQTSVTQIATEALVMPYKEITRSVQIRIGMSMGKLGYTKVRVRQPQGLVWLYRRP
jgi:predicted P-loop ATPase